MTKIRSFIEDFNSIVNLYPERIAFESIKEDETIITYKNLDVLIKKMLVLFSEKDIKPNALICSILPNSLESLILFLSCMKGGYKYAPIHFNYTQKEVKESINFIKPDCIFYNDLVSEEIINIFENYNTNSIEISFSTLNDIKESKFNFSSENNGKLYIFTSGTSGKQKSIVHDINKLWSSGHFFSRLHNLNFDSEFKIWNYLSHSYLGGLFNLCLIPLSIGGTIVVDDNFTGKTFLSFWQTIERCKINALWLVPSIVSGLVTIAERIKRKDISTFKKIDIAFLGTAPIQNELKNRFKSIFNIRLLENFALSETTFLTSQFLGLDPDDRFQSSGIFLDHIEFKFKKLEETITGNKLFVKTPFMMDGYLQEDSTIYFEKDDEGFFDTGDLGVLDHNKNLIITGREKDIIKKGGYFISLKEIEYLSNQHSSVEESAAVKQGHKFYGESYKLYIKLKDNFKNKISLEIIKDHIYDNLTKYKWPEEIELINSFPKTSSGKIIKGDI